MKIFNPDDINLEKDRSDNFYWNLIGHVKMTEDKKRKILIELIKLFKVEIFFETGTFEGETIINMFQSCENLKSLYSVEINKRLFAQSVYRMSRALHLDPRLAIYPNTTVDTVTRCTFDNYKKTITLFLANSEFIFDNLKSLIQKKQIQVSENSIFYLDAHSVNSSAFSEMKMLLSLSIDPIILIDDAHHFACDRKDEQNIKNCVTGIYYPNISDIIAMIKNSAKDYRIFLVDFQILLIPRKIFKNEIINKIKKFYNDQDDNSVSKKIKEIK